MILNDLLKNIEVLDVEGGAGIDVSAVVYDSRKALPGCIFAAVKGVKADGNSFIDMAVGKGAVAVLHQDYAGPRASGVTYVRVPDARRAMALAAANLHGRPSSRLKLIGITGTNGKTTTSYLIKSVIESAGGKAGLLGTISYVLGDEKIAAPNTTPESVDLQEYLARMAEAGAGFAVLEVSSHAVSLDRIAGCEFAVKVFTNFTQDHLDFHGTMEEYYAAKKELFTAYGGVNIINLDDLRGADLASSSKGRTLTYAINEKADIRATGITLGPSGLAFVMDSPEGAVKIDSPLVGRHNVYNILAAAGACIASGISLSEVASGIAGMREVPGRLEKVDAGQDFVVLVDYAHTEDALERVLVTAREFTPGRLITVFGCGGDRDRTKRPRMGRVASRLSDIVVLTSDNPRTEPSGEILAQAEAGIIEEGSKSKGKGYFILEDRAESIDFAIATAKPGDTVLIAGKGHEDYQIIGERKFHFDDRESARKSVLKRLKCA